MFLAGASAFAETWRPSSKSGFGSAFIETDSIKREGAKVTFWREVRFAGPRTLKDGTQIDRIATYHEGNCSAMTLQSLRLRPALVTKVLGDFTADGRVEWAKPGSTAETDLRAVCLDQWPG